MTEENQSSGVPIYCHLPEACPDHKETRRMLEDDRKELEKVKRCSNEKADKKTMRWAFGIVAIFVSSYMAVSFDMIGAQGDRTDSLDKELKHQQVQTERILGEVNTKLETIKILLGGQADTQEEIKRDVRDIKQRLRKIEQKGD